MNKKILIVFVVVAASAALIFFLSFSSSTSKVTATVARVIDGDTVELANGDKVRLLGIDGPEKGNYYYLPTRERLKELVEGKAVSLEKDVSSSDSFGRLLRYIFLGDEFINLKMVEEGCAYAYVVAPDEKYLDDFITAEEEARQKQLLIWENSVHSDCITARMHQNAKGDDNENLNDEYVVFKNRCSYEVDMSDWLVKDQQTNNYTFPNFILSSGRTVTLRSGLGEDSESELFWYSLKPIWNNAGDTLYLRDADGKIILKYSYGKN